MTSGRLSITRPDGTVKTADELQRDADQLVRDAQTRAENVRSELSGNVVEATSRNQAATVTVTAAGALQSVRFSDRARGLSPAQLSTSVMEAYQEASRQAAARTIEIAGRELGSDRVTSMMRELLPDYARPAD